MMDKSVIPLITAIVKGSLPRDLYNDALCPVLWYFLSFPYGANGWKKYLECQPRVCLQWFCIEVVLFGGFSV